MTYSEGDFVVVVNVRRSTSLWDGTYAIVSKAEVTGHFAHRYKIRIISGGKPGDSYWIHPNDLVSAEFYCNLMAQKVIIDQLTDWYLEKLSKAKTKKARKEILAALAEVQRGRRTVQGAEEKNREKPTTDRGNANSDAPCRQHEPGH